MTTEPAPPPTPTAPSRERGWGRVLAALILLVVLPVTPFLRILVPVDHTLLLFAPALAACALAGWWGGGRLSLAVLWVALAAWALVGPRGIGTGFPLLARGWAILAAAAFLATLLALPDRRFLTRGLAAVALALVMGTVAAAAAPGGLPALRGALASEIGARATQASTAWRQATAGAEWRAMVAKNPAAATLAAQVDRQLVALAPAAAVIVPAMLALETLAALALAWAVYHRVGRVRLGPPLVPLGEFRFSDQLVWGLVAGLALVVVPGFAAWRGLGANLLLFFSTLYAVRGLGVLLWFLAPGRLMTAMLILFGVLFWHVLGFVALGLGLGDTWMDWRRRARSIKT